MKQNYQVRKKELVPYPDYNAAFSLNEIKVEINNMKLSITAGFDGVYVEIFKLIGPKTQCSLLFR